ncbi:MAG TPA: NAD(P)-dependent oxidoreductase [Candidatus Eremiobacteraceae bacterium]
MMRVGVVGLGKMGSAIARNLLARGYQVSVWNRSPGAVDALVGSGATPQPSIEELTKAVDAVIISLWGDAAARDVTLDRVIPAARVQQLIIEMSTLSPAMYETLESGASARSVEFLAAPVLGSVNLAQQGSLTVLAGGGRATFERARPLLDSLGTTVTFTGSASASGVLKLANNTIIGVVAETLAELLQLCDQGGIDHRLAVESVSGAFGRVASSKTQQLLDRDSEPRFSLSALLKDLQLARDAAESLHVSLSMLDCVLPAVQRAAASGLGDRDYIALALERTPPASATPHG